MAGNRASVLARCVIPSNADLAVGLEAEPNRAIKKVVEIDVARY
jgi:hypothetical protein